MDIIGDSAKLTALRPFGSSLSDSTGMLDMAARSAGATRVILKVAFTAGSSQQGKARRASVASSWVVAR